MLGRWFRLLCGLAVLLAGLAFHLKNRQPVTLDFYVAQFDLPLSWAVVSSVVVGALCGVLAMLPGLVRARRTARRLTRQAQLATRAAAPPDAMVPHGE
ncbi:MAG: LapA family protein [Gammaproteobacteria bacterium]|nr:LapA family protein [Gammaproteobacteria bacterium]